MKKMKNKIYGYVRVSTMRQSIERQIKNIKKEYPEAIIFHEEFTGTQMNRPKWNELYSSLKKGDIVVFDSVSRMSRNAEEGLKVYKELYGKGVELIFLKEPYINTRSYRKALKNATSLDVKPNSGNNSADEFIKDITKAINNFMMAKVEDDIKNSFLQAEKEVEDLRQRISEGLALAKTNNKQIGRNKGDKLVIKKAKPIKELIQKYSKDFDGYNNDSDVISILATKKITIPQYKRNGKVEYKEVSAKLSRNTYYKYKKEMLKGYNN